MLANGTDHKRERQKLQSTKTTIHHFMLTYYAIIIYLRGYLHSNSKSNEIINLLNKLHEKKNIKPI